MPIAIAPSCTATIGTASRINSRTSARDGRKLSARMGRRSVAGHGRNEAPAARVGPLGRPYRPVQEADMTPRILLGSALVLAAAAFATAAETQADRDLKSVTNQIAKAERILVRAPAYERKAAQLYAYDQAVVLLTNARRTAARWSGAAFGSAWDDAAYSLVRAYDEQTQIYLDRGSLPSARKHNEAALAVDPLDVRARNLKAMITAAEETDILDKNTGGVAIDRIVERRQAAGMPLRERGVPGSR